MRLHDKPTTSAAREIWYILGSPCREISRNLTTCADGFGKIKLPRMVQTEEHKTLTVHTA